jgi:heptosyltransferase-2
MKIKDKDAIKKILVITLSNIGDIVLTTPVLSVLKREFPAARIDVLCGPNGKEIFSGHPFVYDFIMYDKLSKPHFKKELIRKLRINRYDLVVDLKNSLLPLLIGARRRTPIIRPAAPGAVHKKDEHLRTLERIGLPVKDAQFAFYLDDDDRNLVSGILADREVKKDFVVVSPGAKSHIKRWTKEAFASVCDALTGELGLDVVMVGAREDAGIISEIKALMKNKAFDLSGKLSLRQLGALIERSRLLITTDSAPMHIGHALGAKVLAIFGPTDPKKYGPKGQGDVIIRKALACSPCETAQCKKNHECMKIISAREVFEAAKKMLI